MAQILNNTYEILELVGKGGMSTVFKARHIRLNTVVAVKSVRKNQAVDLLAEVSILTKLNHPNLVRVMDVFEDDRLIYIVMDYIEGEDLQHVIKREKKIPEEKVREWFITLAEVLGYLHSRVPPIIYRDMKPANIILQKDGTLKLVDFGIAREYKANASGDTTYIGTSGFAAPEQFGLAQSDARTDIYSLGMTMYCLATGKSPNEPPYVYLPARQLNPDISEDLEKIIEKCIQISQDERYQSAEELLSDLRNESELPANTAGSRPVKKEEGHTVLLDKGSTGQGKKRMAPLILTALVVIAAGLGAVFKLTGGLPAGSGSKDPAGSSADQGNNTETSEISDTGKDPGEAQEGNEADMSGISESGSAEKTLEQITMTIWVPTEEDADWLDMELGAFREAHPEWELTFNTGICAAGYNSVFIEQDPEAAADVYMYANDEIPALVGTGGLARLDGSVLDQVRTQNSQSTVDTVTYNGGVYGVPLTGNTWFMYYDKRVFSDEDVKNLDTMLEKGKVGFPLSNSWYFASFYVANGCTLFGENGDDAEAGFDFSGEKAAAVTNYLVDFVANKNFIDSNGLGPGDLKSGLINCLFSGSWDYRGVVEAIGEENVGICAAPTYTLNGEEKQLKAFAGSKAIGVNPYSKYPDAAAALAAFLGSTQAQQDHYDLRGIIPTDRDVKVGDDALAKAQMDAMDFASIVQPMQSAMSQYWSPAENMGQDLVNRMTTHVNAAERTEKMNEAMNTAVGY